MRLRGDLYRNKVSGRVLSFIIDDRSAGDRGRDAGVPLEGKHLPGAKMRAEEELND
jgi:hypothetical protein